VARAVTQPIRLAAEFDRRVVECGGELHLVRDFIDEELFKILVNAGYRADAARSAVFIRHSRVTRDEDGSYHITPFSARRRELSLESIHFVANEVATMDRAAAALIQSRRR
jgi:hypothetical protein